MDRTLLALAVVGLLASGLAGCIDASAFPFGDDTTTITIPGLAHGQVTTVEADLLRIEFSSDHPSPEVELFPARLVETVREGVHEDRDRYAQPTEAVWIETETTMLDATPEGLEASWTSRSAIETGGGNILYYGVSTPQTFSIGGHSSFGSTEFNDWCSTDLEVPGGIPYHATGPVRYDRTALYGTVLTAGEDVVREYDTEIYVGPGETTTAHVTITLEAVDQTEIPVTVDGVERSLPAIEYRVDRQYEYDGRDTSHDDEEPEVDRRPRVWYADGVPTPVRAVSTFSFGPSEHSLERRVTHFDAGGAPLAVGSGTPAAQFEGVHPDAKVAAWGTTPDVGGLGLAFPLEDAVTALREDPRALKARLWFEQHPDAILERGQYTRQPANETFRWELTFNDDGDVLYATVTRSEPAMPGLSGDRPARISAWDDHPFAGPNDDVSSLDVVDAATALAVGTAFLPDAEDWYSFSFGVSGIYEDGGWQVGPTPYYSIAHGGYAEQSDLLTSYEKEWRSPMLRVDAATGGLSGGVGAGLSCGSSNDVGLPMLLTA